jgi:hypothetical protein
MSGADRPPDTAWPDAPSPDSLPVEPGDPAEPRPWIERIGLAGIALVLGTMFGVIAAASWSGGEPFLAVMGGVGCLMTLWVGALTLVRG